MTKANRLRWGITMHRRASILLVCGSVVLLQADLARAGMPSVTLTDLARMRLQTISFFLVGILASACVVQRLWNGLARDVPRLPRLGFGRALGVVTLWGLLFVLVLTMISGARELMTPKAWEKNGYTYRLVQDDGDAAADRREAERRLALERLRVALWTYARNHDGRFPPADDLGAIPEEVWRVPDPSGISYRYVGGLVADEGQTPLAYEPGIFGEDQLVLRTDGRIVLMTLEEFDLLPAEGESP